jgi:membrane fusion protein (multidrug efflux system)
MEDQGSLQDASDSHRAASGPPGEGDPTDARAAAGQPPRHGPSSDSLGKPGPGGGGGRRIAGVVFPLVLVLGLLAAGGYWYLKIREIIETDDAVVDADRMVVSTRVFGRVVVLAADEGDTVRVGDPLVQLDDTDLRARVAQAEAHLVLAQESVTLAQVNVERGQEDFDRAQVQFNGQAIPREQLDHARSALASAQAQHAIALAQVEAARADLDVVRTQLEDTRVLSPFTGVVAKRWVLQGEVVQAGQPILTLYDLDHVWVTAYFEETKLRSIPLGSRAEVSVDAFPSRSLHGTVTLLGAAAASQFSLIPPNNASGNFTKVTQRVPVRVALDHLNDGQESTGPYSRLLPGMSVVVRILREEE